MKKEIRRYSQKEKREALITLRDNSFNYFRTEKQTGISRDTLRRWATADTTGTIASNSIRAMEDTIELNAAKVRMQFIQRHYGKLSELAGKTIDKALSLLDNEPDLQYVNGLLKIVTDFVLKLNESGQVGENSAVSNIYNVIQQTIHNCNANSRGAGNK
jgi:hypothetical protein